MTTNQLLYHLNSVLFENNRCVSTRQISLHIGHSQSTNKLINLCIVVSQTCFGVCIFRAETCNVTIFLLWQNRRCTFDVFIFLKALVLCLNQRHKRLTRWNIQRKLLIAFHGEYLLQIFVLFHCFIRFTFECLSRCEQIKWPFVIIFAF